MYESRTLGRSDSLLRDNNGSANLAGNLGAWFTAQPRDVNEVWSINSLEITLAGKGLLQSLGQFGDAAGRLELGFDVIDGLGYLRNVVPVTLHSIEMKQEWDQGTFTRAVSDLEAGLYQDKQPRAGIRGVSNQAAGTPPASWQGPLVPVLWGSSISSVTWQTEPVRDVSGNPIDNGITLSLATAVRDNSGNLAWSQPSIVAATGAEIVAGRRDFAQPIRADAFRWQVDLQFLDAAADAAAHATEGTRRTGVVFLLGAWINMNSPLWVFDRLADLLSRSTMDRMLQPGGWDGTMDAALVRLDCNLTLTGRRKEVLRARLSAPRSTISILEIRPVTRVIYTDVG